MAALRVVSVLPSATEIVCALGHGDRLVGRSAECDYPESVHSLPVVMTPRHWDADAPSGEIDARVREARGRGESLYTLDVDLLRELRPDVLLTQDLCGVCSVTGPEVEAACARAGVRPAIVSLTPRTLEDVWSSVEIVGAAIGDRTSGTRLANQLREASHPTPTANPPRIAVLEWLDPPLLSGLWTPTMITAAGGSPIGTETGAPGVRTDWTTIRKARPELVVVSPCSFSVERTERELEEPALRKELARLNPTLGTWLADEAYFSRPGPRLADGVALLRHLISREGWRPPMTVRPFLETEVAA
jgi:iron complex transport system substrate-binding protein